MRTPGLAVLAFTGLLPVSAHAQSVNMTDLVGTWLPIDTVAQAKDSLIIRSDTTSNWGSGKTVDKTFHRIERFSGDTIQFWPGGRKFQLTLKDGRLTAFSPSDKASYSYTRAPAGKQP